MKRILYSFMALMILVLGSCQESVYVDDVQESTSKITDIKPIDKVDDDIVARLQAYNDSLLLITSSTNGNNKGDLERGLEIAIADLIGVCKGAWDGYKYGKYLGPNAAVIAASILGPFRGAYYSYKAANDDIAIRTSYETCIGAYIEMKEEDKDYTQYYPKKVVLNIPEGKQDILLYGAMHNLILDNLVNKRISTTSIEEALASNILTTDEYNVLTQSFVKKLFQEPIIVNSSDLQSDLGELSSSIIILYDNALRTSTVSYKDVEKITNKYLAEVFSTLELEETEATQLASCICAFVSSSEYWKVYSK